MLNMVNNINCVLRNFAKGKSTRTHTPFGYRHSHPTFWKREGYEEPKQTTGGCKCENEETEILTFSLVWGTVFILLPILSKVC